MSLSDSDGDAVVVGPGDLQDFNSENILPLAPADLVKITKWLQPTPYDFERSEYSRHRASHLVGTGKWLVSSDIYQQWHSGDNGILWIKGIPGSGKSVMAASIIKELQKGDVPVIYFFFRQIIDANHKPIAALRDWLCQALSYSPPLQVKLKKYLDQGKALDTLSPADLWNDLKIALGSFSRTYCVTDALDEMDQGNDEFLRVLVELGRWRPANVKVLMTSRPVVSLETSLRPFSIPQIRLEERLVDLDISAYVQHKLRSSSIPREQWKVIEEAIPGRANGLFLYAKLSMDAFLEPGANAQDVLKELPIDLNAMYNQLLREHAKRSNVPAAFQLLVLQFVTHATRPLRLLEIAEMMHTIPVSSSDRNLKDTKDLVRAACGPLLEILPDETVSVVHHSFTEFLKGLTRSHAVGDSGYPMLKAGPTNSRLAVACLDYLRSGCLDNLEVTKRELNKGDSTFVRRREQKQREVRLQFPFLEYAAKNWYTHTSRAAAAGSDMSAFHCLLDIFFTETRRYKVWLDIAWSTRETEGITPLHVAALTGLAQYANHLLENGEITKKSVMGLPISWASSKGHADVVQVLIDHGADPDAELHEGLKPMHKAARSNHASVVKVLLAAGVDPLTPKTRQNEAPTGCCIRIGPTTKGQTPLMYACHAGHLESVAEMIPFLKKTKDLQRGLHWAAEKGRSGIVDLIRQQPGLDINVKLRGDTALFLACKSGDLKTIKILIQAGADPNIFCANAEPEFERDGCRGVAPSDEERPRFTPLHILCREGVRTENPNLEPSNCVTALIQAGADIHLKSPDGSTALHYACNSRANLIKPLIEAGADPTAENDAGETPLHSKGNNDDDALPLLLASKTADINKKRSKDGKTPLLCRFEDSIKVSEKIMKFLEYKPNVNATDFQGNGPLHLALRMSGLKSDVVDTLLSAGADPNLRNRAGNTPLHEMSKYVGKNPIEKLLLAGADIEAKNHDGQSVLFAQFIGREMNVRKGPRLVDMLIDLGARLDTRDYKGRTLWHRAIDNEENIDRLKLQGLDPLLVDDEGNTSLHEVAGTKKVNKRELLERFMCLGMDINQRNRQGRTVLHTICSRDDSRMQYRAYSKADKVLDYVLEVCESPSPSDNDGIQPLHIASTISEDFVHKLLNAGADLFAPTHEKMTVLHLAARARQSGIVDMILSRVAQLEDTKVLAFVNQHDMKGRTALHYACRSGRPETVKSLLEAGADPNILVQTCNSPFAMCGNFEREAALWDRRMPCKHDRNIRSGKGINAAGLKLNSTSRPFDDPEEGDTGPNFGKLDTEHDTARLGEILDLLVKYGVRIEENYSSIRCARNSAAEPEYGYTLCCLPDLPARPPAESHSRLGIPIQPSDWELKMLIARHYREATKKALKKTTMPKEGSTWTETRTSTARVSLLENSLALRYYDLFQELAEDKECLTCPNGHGFTPLNLLARWGFSELLAQVCTPEIATKLDGFNWYNKPVEWAGPKSFSPLVVSACARRLPNMDIMKLIVEEFGVNIDAKWTKNEYHDKAFHPVPGGGALHKLAAGKCWWHVDKALPYMIEKGADLDLQDELGQTPLVIAMKSNRPFQKEAARVLIEAGANVNVISPTGDTCLSMADDDLDLIKVLIKHGAEVSAPAIFSAIEFGRVEVLEVLLSQGDYANLRQCGPEVHHYGSQNNSMAVEGEMFPLLSAATSRNSRHKSLDPQIRSQMVGVLLRYGADPFATFSKKSAPFEHAPKDLPLTTGTVIHELISTGQIVRPFFQLPSLDIERRDESGCTMLLAASKFLQPTLSYALSKAKDMDAKEIFEELINRGANATAQANDGKNILHHIRILRADASLSETLRAVMVANPTLVHQVDHAGETPLHYALRAKPHVYVELLLDNGADPLQLDSNGDTALHHLIQAIYAWNEALFKRFLEAGVDINTRNNRGETPIFKFIQVGNEQLCGGPGENKYKSPAFNFFIDSGADIFARNNDGSTLLHILAGIAPGNLYPGDRLKCTSVGVGRFKRLMELGLDPMAEDGMQRTSVDVAAACGNEHVLKLFERRPME